MTSVASSMSERRAERNARIQETNAAIMGALKFVFVGAVKIGREIALEDGRYDQAQACDLVLDVCGR